MLINFMLKVYSILSSSLFVFPVVSKMFKQLLLYQVFLLTIPTSIVMQVLNERNCCRFRSEVLDRRSESEVLHSGSGCADRKLCGPENSTSFY